MVKHHEFRAQLHQRAENMLDHDNGQRIAVVHMPQQFDSRLNLGGRQSRQHFIEQEVSARAEGARDPEPFARGQGEVPCLRVRLRGQPDLFQYVVCQAPRDRR